MLPKQIAGISIPDSALAVEATELVRDTESDLLFDHSLRVYLFGALQGRRHGLKFDPELLYIGAIFHDMGLTEKYRSVSERFEVDGANLAREFLRKHGVAEASVDVVWDAIALHTTPGIPKWKKPKVALVTTGVELDVLGIGYDELTESERQQVLSAFPRVDFKRRIVPRLRRRYQAQTGDGVRQRQGRRDGRDAPGLRPPEFLRDDRRLAFRELNAACGQESLTVVSGGPA